MEGVRAAGGTALLIPPDPSYADDGAAEVLDVIDGLILVGGEDIGSTNYGHEPHVTSDPPNVRRDAAELALARGALARDLPVLGICRGFQVLNIAYGGDLNQQAETLADSFCSGHNAMDHLIREDDVSGHAGVGQSAELKRSETSVTGAEVHAAGTRVLNLAAVAGARDTCVGVGHQPVVDQHA